MSEIARQLSKVSESMSTLFSDSDELLDRLRGKPLPESRVKTILRKIGFPIKRHYAPMAARVTAGTVRVPFSVK